MNRVILFILGVLLSSIGLMFDLLYLNLFNMGYNFFDYVKFIISRIECLLLFIGIIMIIISLKGRLLIEYIQEHSSKF